MEQSNPSASAVIGALGGTVEITDPASPLFGAGVTIPAGALPDERTITIAAGDTEGALVAPFPGAIQLTPVIKFGPDGMHFQRPVELRLPLVAGASLNADTAWSAFIENDGELRPVPSGFQESGAGVVAATNHFSSSAAYASSGGNWTDTNARAPFDFAADTFPIAISDRSCGGIVALADWFLRTGKSGLHGYFSATRASEVAADAHLVLGGDSGGMDQQPLLSMVVAPLAGALLHQLLQSGVRPLVGILGSAGDGRVQGHAVLVYGYDAATKSFSIYDPADNLRPATIAVDPATGKLGDYTGLLAGQTRTEYRFLFADSRALHVAFMAGTWKLTGQATDLRNQTYALTRTFRVAPERQTLDFGLSFALVKDPAAPEGTLYRTSTSGQTSTLEFTAGNDYWAWHLDRDGDGVMEVDGACLSGSSRLTTTVSDDGRSAAGSGVSRICPEAPSEFQGAQASLWGQLSRP